MCIDGHISGSASQALVLPVWNVFFGLRVDVLFCQAKVNDVDNVLLFIPLPSNEKVFRFYISVNEVFRVHILHSGNLVRKKQMSAVEITKLLSDDILAEPVFQSLESRNLKEVFKFVSCK